MLPHAPMPFSIENTAGWADVILSCKSFRSSVYEFQILFPFACTSIAQSDKIKNKQLNHLGYINFVCMFLHIQQRVKSVTCRQDS
jgi:hypothetical protein